MEFATRSIKIEDSLVRAQIWDTAGQERYKAITNAYYRNAVGALLVYDITKKSTFDNIEKWYNELKDYASNRIIVLLVGNKTDKKQEREVSRERGLKYAEQTGIGFIETSALDASNVDKAFMGIIKEIYHLTLEDYFNED